jgi:hypothetical protein
MPVKQRISLKNVSAVAASKTVIIEVPVGPRIHLINIQHGFSSGTNTIAGAATNISEIRFKLNNRIQRRFSGTQLRDLNLLMGAAYDAVSGEAPNTAPGVSFPLYFAEPWRKNTLVADALALATGGGYIKSCQVEVDLGAASTPTLVAWAVVDDVQFGKAPTFTKILPINFGASGTKFDTQLTDQEGALTQISLYPDSGGSNAATQVTLRKGSLVLHELTASANKALLLHSGMTPAASGRTASIYDIVLDHDDLVDSALPLDSRKDVSLTIEAGSAMSGTITGFVQRIGTPE